MFQSVAGDAMRSVEPDVLTRAAVLQLLADVLRLYPMTLRPTEDMIADMSRFQIAISGNFAGQKDSLLLAGKVAVLLCYCCPR